MASASRPADETVPATEPADRLAAWAGLRPLVDQLLRGIATAVSADRATLTRVDGAAVVIEGSFDAFGPAAESGWRWEITDPEMQRLIVDQQPLIRGLDPTTLPSPFREQLAGVRHMVVLPLTVAGKVFGTITVSRREDSEFSSHDLKVLRDLGDVAVVALRNSFQLARAEVLTAQERELADRVEALERTKSQFLGLASHELRTPVSLIRGYLSLFKGGDLGVLNENGKLAVSVLEGQVLQLHLLIDQILQAASLQSGTLAPNQEDFDLRELVATTVEWARELTASAHTVSLTAPSDPVPVTADREWLSTILHNLFDNAVKYSPDGGSIHCEVLTDSNWAHVKVTDQGFGLDPDQLSQLFQQFGRVVSAGTAGILGAGLGLYLARELARLHGGDIVVESDPRCGSTFVLVLPLRRQ